MQETYVKIMFISHYDGANTQHELQLQRTGGKSRVFNIEIALRSVTWYSYSGKL